LRPCLPAPALKPPWSLLGLEINREWTPSFCHC
jgi:hypothetical protein